MLQESRTDGLITRQGKHKVLLGKENARLHHAKDRMREREITKDSGLREKDKKR